MPETRTVREWVVAGGYLPPPLRDFHDQKDVFKSLHEWIGKPVEPMYGDVLLNDLRRAGCSPELVEQVREAQRISWVAGQCYVIDYVLRFFAACGWTLQRSRLRLPFASLTDTITARRERETALLRTALTTEDSR